MTVRAMRAMLAMVVPFAGCGSSVPQGGSGGSSSTVSWPAYCEARASACGISADACKAQEECARKLLRDQSEDAMLTCLSKTCSWQKCVGQLEADFDVTAKGTQYDQQCSSYADACPGQDDSVCQSTPVYADSLLDQLSNCATMIEDCSAASTCFDEVRAATTDECKDWF